MSVQLLTEHHLEFLSLKEGCTGSSVSTLVKMPYCWKSRVTAQMLVLCLSRTLINILPNESLEQYDEKLCDPFFLGGGGVFGSYMFFLVPWKPFKHETARLSTQTSW